jgi:hypothetical protein
VPIFKLVVTADIAGPSAPMKDGNRPAPEIKKQQQIKEE